MDIEGRLGDEGGRGLLGPADVVEDDTGRYEPGIFGALFAGIEVEIRFESGEGWATVEVEEEEEKGWIVSREST